MQAAIDAGAQANGPLPPQSFQHSSQAAAPTQTYQTTYPSGTANLQNQSFTLASHNMGGQAPSQSLNTFTAAGGESAVPYASNGQTAQAADNAPHSHATLG